MLKFLGKLIIKYLTQPHGSCAPGMPTSTQALEQSAQAGDVLLIEGRERISTAIKYLTQSTWSHAALCVGHNHRTGALEFIETDAAHGVRLVTAGHYKGYHMRLCRPSGLAAEEVRAVCDYATARIGDMYDVRNVIDLARYLFPTPPVPLPWRRRMIALGSGDSTKAICSTLIAQAFEAVRYPVLPKITEENSNDADCMDCVHEILHIRHFSLYTPRDFDVSPYFEIVKPTLTLGFDYRTLKWADEAH
jgi:Permuted papain-like amidase enzyme, YaeF/YiiX, C92 family